MANNPFYVLSEETGTETTDASPKTQERAFIPVTPRILKKKRKLDIPLFQVPSPNPTPLAKKRTATSWLNLARNAIGAAIEAEREEMGEEYIVDSDIQLIYNDLVRVTDLRPIEPYIGTLDDLDLQAQLNMIHSKLDRAISNTTTSNTANNATQAYPTAKKAEGTATQEKATLQEKPKSFAEALKRPQTKTQASTTATQPQKGATFKDRRLILQGTAKKGQKIDSLGLRNQINKAFAEKCQILTPVVGTVTLSQ